MNKDLAIKEKSELISVLQNSLYVGAKPESINMVISYCAAAHLDIMQKPVHIVPMNAKNAVTGNYEWRDVVMPGVGLYRIQADRSGTLAGITEPEFGPDVTKTFKDKNGNQVNMTFPEWCKISVKKLIGTTIVEFTSKEYWIENYATDSGKSDAPNAMWRKRPRGQLAKCCEAQSLRKGWPEIGQAPTAEEMEGKSLDVDIQAEPEIKKQKEYPIDKFNSNFSAWSAAIKSNKKTAEEIISMVSTVGMLNEEQKQQIRNCEVIEGELQNENN